MCGWIFDHTCSWNDAIWFHFATFDLNSDACTHDQRKIPMIYSNTGYNRVESVTQLHRIFQFQNHCCPSVYTHYLCKNSTRSE